MSRKPAETGTISADDVDLEVAVMLCLKGKILPSRRPDYALFPARVGCHRPLATALRSHNMYIGLRSADVARCEHDRLTARRKTGEDLPIRTLRQALCAGAGKDPRFQRRRLPTTISSSVRAAESGSSYTNAPARSRRMRALNREEQPLKRPAKTWVEAVAFDVFRPEGSYRGFVKAPQGMRLYPRPVARSDTVWAVVEDDLGVQRIMRLILEFQRGGP